jgi:hypothetical protein
MSHNYLLLHTELPLDTSLPLYSSSRVLLNWVNEGQQEVQVHCLHLLFTAYTYLSIYSVVKIRG